MGSRNIEEEEKLELKQSRNAVQKKWNFKHKESNKKNTEERKRKFCFRTCPLHWENTYQVPARNQTKKT